MNINMNINMNIDTNDNYNSLDHKDKKIVCIPHSLPRKGIKVMKHRQTQSTISFPGFSVESASLFPQGKTMPACTVWVSDDIIYELLECATCTNMPCIGVRVLSSDPERSGTVYLFDYAVIPNDSKVPVETPSSMDTKNTAINPKHTDFMPASQAKSVGHREHSHSYSYSHPQQISTSSSTESEHLSTTEPNAIRTSPFFKNKENKTTAQPIVNQTPFSKPKRRRFFGTDY
eukprot:gb/GECH01004570.1/.p1 GENE.gb/GECH01004570.1/~~gb/GECH01004570.1/.p1  ORF type:complete len:231 (+),score=47.51 gb/GECH01004570.1/:1-693(+)